MLLLLLALAVYVLLQSNALRKQNRDLERRLSRLEAALQEAPGEMAGSKRAPAATNPPQVADTFVFETVTPSQSPSPPAAEATPQQSTPQAPWPLNEPPPAPAAAAKTASSGFWKKTEGQFLENWTGILGALIMVTGVAFLGGFAYLQMSPLFRFLLLLAFAGLLIGVFILLRSRPRWLKLALWLRSSAAAILLFACLGAGGLPALQWVRDPQLALLLLGFGIAVNLFLSFIGRRQAIASIHVLLSLAALAVAPASSMSLIIATLVTLFGVAQTYRDKWDYHLLLTVSSFFLFHLAWYLRVPGGADEAGRSLFGLAVVVAVGLAAALVHYRQAYETGRLEALPFATHLLNWLYFGFGLLCYAQGTPWKTVFLAGGGVLAYVLARRARRVPVRWLYLTDTLVAQLLLVLALVSLRQWQVGPVAVCALTMLAGLLFAAVAAWEKERLLHEVGSWLAQLSGLLLVLLTCLDWYVDDWPQRTANALWLGLCILAGTILHGVLRRAELPESTENRQGLPDVQLMAGLMAVALYVQMYRLPWAEYGLLLAVPLFYWRQRSQDHVCGRALWLFLLGTHGVFWLYFLPRDSLAWGLKTAHALPLLALAGAAGYWSWNRNRQRHDSWIGTYLLAGNLFLISYDLGRAYSPLVPGVVWLLLSLAALELSSVAGHRQDSNSERHLLYAGQAYLVAFLGRYFLVHVPSEAYLGVFSVRLLVELLALAVLLCWALRKQPLDSQGRHLNRLMPLFSEVTLLLTVFILILELGEFWYPLCWMGLAYVCLAAGCLLGAGFSRLRLYALWFSWAAVFHLAFLSSSYVVPVDHWYRQAWFAGLLTILLQLPFGYLVCTRKALDDFQWPVLLQWLSRPAGLFQRHTVAWVFYPFFAALALFLYWNFDKALLTLLWVLEAFVIFTFSILLRARHFRYTALTAIGLCLLRLVFYDLASAGTLTRALVFLGVGIIMLLIHALFNHYRERLSDG